MLKLYFIVIKNNLKQLKLHIIVAAMFLALIPAFSSTRYLNENEVTYLAEHFICLIGIILLVPVFLAEEYTDIKELLLSKKIPLTLIWLQRILLQVILLAIMIGIDLKVYQLNLDVFSYGRMYDIAFANAIFLGGMGILAYSIFHQWIVGYMLPLCYYMLSLLWKDNWIVKTLSLFSTRNHSLLAKHYLLMAGIACIIVGLVFLEKTKRVIRE